VKKGLRAAAAGRRASARKGASIGGGSSCGGSVAVGSGVSAGAAEMCDDDEDEEEEDGEREDGDDVRSVASEDMAPVAEGGTSVAGRKGGHARGARKQRGSTAGQSNSAAVAAAKAAAQAASVGGGGGPSDADVDLDPSAPAPTVSLAEVLGPGWVSPGQFVTLRLAGVPLAAVQRGVVPGVPLFVCALLKVRAILPTPDF
jgi:hypothetical protein